MVWPFFLVGSWKIEKAKCIDFQCIFHSFEGRADVIQMLIEKGIDINLQNKDDKTPLIIAIENGNELIFI